MDFSEDDPVIEKMLRMGRMFGWFDVSLKEKIDALQKEIKMSKETNILAFTGNREELASDDDDKLTARDIVQNVDISADNNDDEIVNGVDSDDNTDGNIGGTDDSGDNGSRDNEHNDDGNIGGTDDSGDTNISVDNGSRDNEHNDDGNIGGTDDSGDDNISVDNGSRDNDHNDDGNIGGTDDSGDDNISDGNGSRDNDHNDDGNIGGTDSGNDNISDDNGSRDNDDDDEIIEDSGNDVNDGKSDDNENDGNNHGDNDDEEYGNIDDSVDGGGSVNDDSVLIDNSDESDDDDGDNYCNSDIDNHYLYPLDSVANSCEINEEFPTSTELEMQLVISKDNNQVTDDKEDTYELNPVEEFESMRSTDEHSFMASDVKTISTKLFNRETTDGTESNEESQFVQVPCSYSYSKDHSIESNVCDDGGGNDNNVDEDEVIKHKDNVDDQDIATSPLVNPIKIDDGDLSTRELFPRPVSSMTDCSNNDDISDSPDIPASLGARLFKKYNPEKSESDMDDFEMFLQKMRTPKKPIFSDKEKKLESKSLDEFIVDGDNDDLEEDVFMDPGFTEEFDFDSDSDKENDDCIEITPVASYTPFKTPTTDFSWKTPKSTKPKSQHTGLSSSKHSRPKSVLEHLLTPYSTEKNFKMNREKLVKDLLELYNRTVFDNQLPSDFQVTWNKKMRSTAGFCYYSRKNGLRMSRIELADKVIDSSDRLRDTLIHEMCHAASWVISDVKAGHGPVWKKWTRRANFVHQDLPPISRCHSYTISTKYTYRCTKCSNSFGRHSKSVNLEKSRCAHCHGRLELVPQLKKDGTPQTRTPSRFAMFVKENFARIKKDNGTFSHQEVMKALSSEFAKLCR